MPVGSRDAPIGYPDGIETSSRPGAGRTDLRALAQRAVDLLCAHGERMGVAESCTAGLVVAHLALADGASDCLRGGVVAYDSAVKHGLLGVRPGPVVSESSARQMAEGARRVVDADVGLATTGVVGPAPLEDQPVGTLWLAVATPARTHVRGGRVAPGAPRDVRGGAVTAALGLLVAVLADEAPSVPDRAPEPRRPP